MQACIRTAPVDVYQEIIKVMVYLVDSIRTAPVDVYHLYGKTDCKSVTSIRTAPVDVYLANVSANASALFGYSYSTC